MRRQQVDAGGRPGAEPDPAADRPGLVGHRPHRLAHRRLDPADMRQQLAPRRGRLDPPPEPLQQPHPEPPFELADLQADRRLGQVQRLGGGRDAAERDDLPERVKLVEIELPHAENSYATDRNNKISFCDKRRDAWVMSAKPTVRPCEDRDVPSLRAIYAHHVLHGLASFEFEPPGEDEMRRRRQAVIERGYPYLVAEIGGDVVGYAYASPYRARPGYRFSAENSIYIRHGWEGRGIGRALLAPLIDSARRWGCG